MPFFAPKTLSMIAVPALAFSLSLPAGPASADEFTDILDEVLELYKAGDKSAAKEALEYAEELLAQQESKEVVKLFPAPLDGWTVEDAKDGGSMAGFAALGGFAVARKYVNNQTNVIITLAGDSPMIQQFGMIFANPALLRSSGGTLHRINRQKVIVTKDGNVQALVSKRYLIMIEGNADEATKLEYFKGFDVRGLTSRP